MNDAFNAYRSMIQKDKDSVDQTVKEMITEFKRRDLWEANTYRLMRFKLLNGNYKSQREKQVLIRFIDELKKVLVS